MVNQSKNAQIHLEGFKLAEGPLDQSVRLAIQQERASKTPGQKQKSGEFFSPPSLQPILDTSEKQEEPNNNDGTAQRA